MKSSVASMAGKVLSRKRSQLETQCKENKCRLPVRTSDSASGKHWALLRQNVTTQLTNVQKNIVVSYGLAEYYALAGEVFGGGVRADKVLVALRDFDARVKRILQCANSSRSTTSKGKRRTSSLRLGRASELSAVLADDVKCFAGQIMLLPISLAIYTGAKAKDCRMVIEYGGKNTTIDGSQFNGKCSKIPLDVHPTCIPKITLIHRKKIMGLFLKEEPQGEVQWMLTHARPLEFGHMMVDLSFIQSSYCNGCCPTAHAVVQLEWFPKVCVPLTANSF
ncbi:uncharacterized protein LOC111249977 [Varroa destructor]|uniref:Uncharacterized protein n=1 Tax=Varroa destructor TaxID=109461 RepID=A0A7M7K231_VARDE|nr:uncharacterized protein LOC111249977 [Varroa destructor]